MTGRLVRGLRRSSEEGQTLVLMAGGMIVLVALLAFSIDVGRLVVTRSNLQTSADAGALAAAQDLPSPSTAEGSGASWAGLNSSGSDSIGDAATTNVDVTSTNTSNDTVTVSVERAVPFTFGKLVGLDTATIEAEATARIAYYNGGRSIQPWGLAANSINSCFIGSGSSMKFKTGSSCTLRESAGDGQTGNYGPMALDANGNGGAGGKEYRENIVHGSDSAYSVGDQIQPEAGLKQGPTTKGLAERLQLPRPEGCTSDNFNDIFEANSDGTYSIKPGCEDHPRIIIIPVVDTIDGPGQATILDFAFMYLEDVKQGKGNGQDEVTGRFVTLASEIPGGLYNGTEPSNASIVRLVN